jgi:hypothetical protein
LVIDEHGRKGVLNARPPDVSGRVNATADDSGDDDAEPIDCSSV